MSMRRFLLPLLLVVAAASMSGCIDLDNLKSKPAPLPIPTDKALATRPCDEDAAGRVLSYYKLMSRTPKAQTAKTAVIVRSDRWGTIIDCIVPVFTDGSKGENGDRVTFSISSSTDFEKWWTSEHVAELGAQYQEEYGSKVGEKILVASKDGKPIEAVWVADDGLFMSVRAERLPLGVPEQRAMLLAVATEIHDTYKSVAGVK